MSLEASLDEERREVMALLEGQPGAARPPRNAQRSGSPHAGSRTRSPAVAAPPIRSMLDVDGPLPTSPPTSPQPAAARSPTQLGDAHYRYPNKNPESHYKFNMLPSIEAHAMPKRVTQGGKKKQSQSQPRSLSHVFAQSDHNALGGRLAKGKSTSPGPSRSQSPGGRKLNDPHKYMTDSGKVVDMTSAYRRLSDGAMLRSGGALASLPTRKGSDPARGVIMAPGGGVRLAKDEYEDDEGAIQSSEDDDSSSASSADGEGGGEDWKTQRQRGRRRSRDNGASQENVERRAPKSLLAAAEDERKDVSQVYKVRSLLEPAVTITGPDGEKMSSKKKGGIHPHTSYDQGGGSGRSTPYTSDAEGDFTEMKAAQQLTLKISPIHSSPDAHRCVRQILRGNYAKFQDDAEKGLRRQRVYLVATDLSEEAAYALEWTVGTVLRDGDTLLAVYAVDEETGVGGTDGQGGDASTPGTGGGVLPSAQQETNSLMKTMSYTRQISEASPTVNTVTTSESDVAQMGTAEKARYNACVEVSDRCVKLLRRTRLQVRVVVEVFHCKSPKHMITEVIDFLEPTLVILGSRGRSALKGVLLGSFSNYLVTKSSVPVMVARKRLRKHSKYKRKNLRLSNVLQNPAGRLANAKID